MPTVPDPATTANLQPIIRLTKGGATVYVGGTYFEFQSHRKIVFSWDTNPERNPPEVSSIVTVEFFDQTDTGGKLMVTNYTGGCSCGEHVLRSASQRSDPSSREGNSRERAEQSARSGLGFDERADTRHVCGKPASDRNSTTS